MLNRKNRICLFLLLCTGLNWAADADVHDHIYLGGFLGASRARVAIKDFNITYYDGLLNDAYPLLRQHKTAGILGINGGYEFAGAHTRPAIALGLGVYSTVGFNHLRGQLVETAAEDPPFLLYHYNYHMSSIRLMSEAQCTWNLWQLLPFINVGIGPAWNRLGSYSETTVDDIGYVVLPPFRSNTTTHFAYQMGLGVAYAFHYSEDLSQDQHERLSLGYRYASLGNTTFGTRGAVYPYSLNAGKLTSNEFYISYTHFFDKEDHEISKDDFK